MNDQTLTYKGLTGKCRYDRGLNLFVGRVEVPNGVVGFVGETATKAGDDFIAAVDDYLSDNETELIQTLNRSDSPN